MQLVPPPSTVAPPSRSRAVHTRSLPPRPRGLQGSGVPRCGQRPQAPLRWAPRLGRAPAPAGPPRRPDSGPSFQFSTAAGKAPPQPARSLCTAGRSRGSQEGQPHGPILCKTPGGGGPFPFLSVSASALFFRSFRLKPPAGNFLSAVCATKILASRGIFLTKRCSLCATCHCFSSAF